MPTAATPEPAAETPDANHSSRTPRTSRAPSSEKIVTTAALTTNTAIAAWTKTWRRSPRRMATMPAMPAQEDVRGELERQAVHGPADDRHERDDDGRERRVEQDREQHPDRGGREEELEDRRDRRSA